MTFDSESVNLEIIRRRYRSLAKKLGAPYLYASIPTKAEYQGAAYAEQSEGSYFYIVSERGQEYERRKTQSPQELLSWFVRDLTGYLARGWELDNRISGTDPRRQHFPKHIELLKTLDQSWAKAQEQYYETILAKYPFDDTPIQRSDYAAELKRQGHNHDDAWRIASEKFSYK